LRLAESVLTTGAPGAIDAVEIAQDDGLDAGGADRHARPAAVAGIALLILRL